MWVKICGLTRPQDARACSRAGADAVGLNFLAGPRRIDTDRARDILRALEPGVEPVALLGCQGSGIDGELLGFLAGHGVRHVQLYGPVTPDLLGELAQASIQVIVTCRVADAGFAASLRGLVTGPQCPRPWAVLLDAHQADQGGGTGRTFPWPWVNQARDRSELAGWPRIILAGGLIPENVADAVRAVRPFGVDVSTGVESAPGVKDHALVRAFVQAARAADVSGPPPP